MKAIESIRARATVLALAFAFGVTLPGCDILDVNNPNNLTEESIEAPAAATALVNGATARTTVAIANVWHNILMASDEQIWIGSRDAWLQLDQGFLSNFDNEFTDAVFPIIGQARWLADRALEIVDGHVATPPVGATPAAITLMKKEQARANFVAGVTYMIIGETQQDFVISDKQEPGPAIGPTKMFEILDKAILRLTNAATIAASLGETAIETNALAMRARARHSRAIWDKIKPTIATNPLVSNTAASADAAAVIARAAATYRYQATFSAATIGNDMAGWINNRGENQFDTTQIVTVPRTTPKVIQSVRLLDPIDNKADPRIVSIITEWKGSTNLGVPGTDYPPLTITSLRLMRLILAEDELSKGNTAGFTTHINAVRALDGLTAWSGQIPALEMLKHERRVNLFMSGLRLNDMYRFGTRDPRWLPNSDAFARPGTLLPITCIERRSNALIGGC